MEIIYDHGYKDGDVVVDTEYKELFYFSHEADNFRAQYSERFRYATEEEKQRLIASNEKCIQLEY